MILKGEWKHRVRNSAHGTDIVYTYLVDTGFSHVSHRNTFNLGVATQTTNEYQDHLNRISQMRAWCREYVGKEIADFNNRAIVVNANVSKERTLCFLFRRENDAFAFMLRFKGVLKT